MPTYCSLQALHIRGKLFDGETKNICCHVCVAITRLRFNVLFLWLWRQDNDIRTIYGCCVLPNPYYVTNAISVRMRWMSKTIFFLFIYIYDIHFFVRYELTFGSAGNYVLYDLDWKLSRGERRRPITFSRSMWGKL